MKFGLVLTLVPFAAESVLADLNPVPCNSTTVSFSSRGGPTPAPQAGHAHGKGHDAVVDVLFSVNKAAADADDAKSAGDYYVAPTSTDANGASSFPTDTSEVSVTPVDLPAVATGSLTRNGIKNAATAKKGAFWVSGMTVSALAAFFF